MRSTTPRRLAAGAAVLGATLCAAAPAHAQLTTPQANAYVVSADAVAGLLAVTPTPNSTYAPGGTNTLLGISAGPFASSDTLTATTSGDPTSGTSAASATVQDLGINLPAIANISVTGVNSQCMATPAGATGNGFVSGGTVSILGLPVATLQANAPENTILNIANLGTLTLNEQAVDPTTEVRTINAIHLVLLPQLGGANVIVGHVSCGGAPATEPVPMISAPIAGGTTAAAAIGGVVYMRRRRRSIFDAS